MSPAERAVLADQLRERGATIEARWIEHPEHVIEVFKSFLKLVSQMAEFGVPDESEQVDPVRALQARRLLTAVNTVSMICDVDAYEKGRTTR